MNTNLLSRRGLLGAALGGAAALALGAPASASPRAHRPRVLVATNEPWGTYHVRPLLAEAARRGWRLTQLVPDLSAIAPGDPVPVATPADAPAADLLVVTGAGDWPADCAAHFRRLPLVASSLAYHQPVQAPRAAELRRRLRSITSSSPAESRAFARHLGTRRPIRVVGSPQTDDLPPRRPEADLVLVLTSVTHPDGTGGAAPGTELLLASAEKLAAAGKRILVGLHPREDRTLWERYEISEVPSVTASARAEVAVGIPGTVFPLVAAVGTPLVGCVDPALTVPDYLLAVCSSTIGDAGEAEAAVAGAALPEPAVLADAVGPVGGSARRLLDAWSRAIPAAH
ncbi:hypothetical protein [Allostreptomyces psammosilenae]|uniref:Uncharacterized protein n=1 Tax=Allostreptomyces psammosilenae TaxID=1892865 RepID=A0A852ZPG8_9ACTN|nr:hypothetical protein [Allostreptomyces psammosilenae]NYI04283.1 hypothetical protein [Allostreptomyces psammosilenae]